jgi:hypothetical protein
MPLTFEFRSHEDRTTDFAMAEIFSGLMIPLGGRSMPDSWADLLTLR